MHVRRYSYFEGSMHLHLLPILGMGGRGPLEKRASPFLGKGRHLRTVPKQTMYDYGHIIQYITIHRCNVNLSDCKRNFEDVFVSKRRLYKLCLLQGS